METATAQTLAERVRERISINPPGDRAVIHKATDDIGSVIYDLYHAAIRYEPGDLSLTDEDPDDPDSIWTDLRPSQQKRLTDLFGGLYDQEQEIVERIVASIVKVAETFAAECPEAVR